jgi:hypothetical protein
MAFSVVGRVRRHQKSGAIYLIGRDYELAYRAVLRFTNGTDLPINPKLLGEINRQVVIYDAQGRPARVSGIREVDARSATAMVL